MGAGPGRRPRAARRRRQRLGDGRGRRSAEGRATSPSRATLSGYPSTRARAPHGGVRRRSSSAARAPTSSSSRELPLRRGRRSPTQAMASAIGDVIEQRGYRAGRFSVGYRICDDSTEEAGDVRPREVRRQRARLRRRPARRDRGRALQLGLRAAADPDRGRGAARPAGDGVADEHRSAADPRRAAGRAAGVHADHGRDDRVAAAMAASCKARHTERLRPRRRRVRPRPAGYFAVAARAAGLRVAGRASWATRTDGRDRRASRGPAPTPSTSSGLLDNGAGAMIHSLRRADCRA